MLDQEFDNYLTLLRSLLRLNGRQRDRIGHELRDHMESRLDELMEEGKSRQTAIQIALEEFGDATAVASTFATMAQLQRRKWIMRFTTISVIGMFVATLFVMSIWPEQGQIGPGGKTVAQDDDPVGVVAEVQDDSVAKSSTTPRRAKRVRRPSVPRLKSKQQRNQEVEKILDEPFTADYQELPFSEAIADISKEKGIQIHMDGTSGLTRDDDITFAMQDTRLRTILDLLLKQYDSTYAIVDGILVICSTDEYQSLPMETRVFDCRKLMAVIEKHKAINQTPLDLLEGGGGIGLGANSVDNIAKNDVNSQDKKVVEETNPLVKVIKQVSPIEWEKNDSTIQSIGGMLIVNQRRHMLRKIEDLISELESSLVMNN
ncbi:permease prefix domain 1-containing protein [Vicingaceae bacterium]|nr:permease prefix domain 1-containing protein [Vicingaceae bacterium]